MSLNEYIEVLQSMRDRYHAGNFKMYMSVGVNIQTGKDVFRPMDGDDFYLEPDTQRCVVGDSCVQP